ncbi:methyltransferase [Candidatus Woesearchaeota archaeon]|nr:methyltransferase [Candidatus Woesearchaeota archaeon]
MKGISITHRGFEDILSREVEEMIGSSPATDESVSIFEYRKFTDLCAFTYKSQSAIKSLHLLGQFSVNNELSSAVSSIKGILSETDLSQWISDGTSFKVSCIRTGEHSFNSQDLSAETSRLIKEKTNKDVNFESPDLIFFIHILNQKGYIGIDFSGIDLSKRDYRIFAHPAALKGTMAYCMLRFSGTKKTNSLIDPFTKSGIIPIEAALYQTGKPVNFYRKEALAFKHLKPLDNEDWETFYEKIDSQENESQKRRIIGIDSSMPSITAAQKNAKLAGVNKSISFSRLDIEWLDTKFSEGEIDRLITNPPESSKRIGEKFVEKLNNELFYQAQYIISKNGKIGLLARNTDLLKKSAEKYGFKTDEERTVLLGKETLKAILFSR